jgi:hypothetical protein
MLISLLFQECSSKNGFVVDEEFRGLGAIVPLTHGSSIVIGPLTAKFSLPIDGRGSNPVSPRTNAGSPRTNAALPVAELTKDEPGFLKKKTKVPRVVAHVLFPGPVKEEEKGQKRSREDPDGAWTLLLLFMLMSRAQATPRHRQPGKTRRCLDIILL